MLKEVIERGRLAPRPPGSWTLRLAGGPPTNKHKHHTPSHENSAFCNVNVRSMTSTNSMTGTNSMTVRLVRQTSTNSMTGKKTT